MKCKVCGCECLVSSTTKQAGYICASCKSKTKEHVNVGIITPGQVRLIVRVLSETACPFEDVNTHRLIVSQHYRLLRTKMNFQDVLIGAKSEWLENFLSSIGVVINESEFLPLGRKENATTKIETEK